MKRITFILALLLTTATMMAEDFAAGDIYIYCNLIGEKSVGVTFRGEKCNSYKDEYFGDIIIPDSVVHEGKTYHVLSIGEIAFAGCSALSSVAIPNSVVNISSGAFGESSIISVDLGSRVVSIGHEAFYLCGNLTAVTIPNSVKLIGKNAFAGCSSLTSIIVAAGNTKFDSRNNCNAIIETATNTLIAGCQNTIIPSGVTSIGEYAFYECSPLTSITIPQGVKSIGTYAFYGCNNLTSITIPHGATSIGTYAFGYCKSLTSVTIPNSVTSIEYGAFGNCSNIQAIYIPLGTKDRFAQMDGLQHKAHLFVEQ